MFAQLSIPTCFWSVFIEYWRLCTYYKNKTGGLISFYPPFSKSHMIRCLNSLPSLKKENTHTGWQKFTCKRHKSAVLMLSLHVPTTCIEESCWMVPSQTDGSIQYIIRVINKTCSNDCKLSCTYCTYCQAIMQVGHWLCPSLCQSSENKWNLNIDRVKRFP